MKTIPVSEVIILFFLVFAFMIVSKKISPFLNVNLPKAESFSTNTPLEETQPVAWYIANLDIARKHLEDCRKSSRLTSTQDCINAEFAIRMSGR